MAKNKLVKNITTDELTVIINKGFQGQMDYMEKKFAQVAIEIGSCATKPELAEVGKRLGVVEKDVKYIKDNLDDAGKLGQRVDYIENVLAIKK